MTRRSFYAINPENIGNFRVGEQFPLKGCNFHVAHVEEGVLILALTGFTKRGQEVLAELKARQFVNDLEETKEDLLNK